MSIYRDNAVFMVTANLLNKNDSYHYTDMIFKLPLHKPIPYALKKTYLLLLENMIVSEFIDVGGRLIDLQKLERLGVIEVDIPFYGDSY